MTDIITTLVPIRVVLNLWIPTRRKAPIVSLFFMAFAADVVSILRIYYSVMQQRSGDTWGQYPAVISGNFEMGLIQLCVSMPTLKPLVNKFGSKFGNSYNGRSRKSYSDGYDSQRPRDALIGESGSHSSRSSRWAQQPRIYAEVDSSKAVDKELAGIKVVHTLELDSMDHTIPVDEEMARDSKTDKVLLQH